jgi:RNA polymerase sigma-70 factor (ECF subfamily)
LHYLNTFRKSGNLSNLLFSTNQINLRLTQNEAIILKGCKNGDKAAQRQFYEVFKKLVFSVVMRYAKDVPEAEDMMQDAFIKLYRDLYQYQPSGALGAWVRRVTVNTALMHLRKKKVLYSEIELYDLPEIHHSSSDVFDTIGAAEIMKMVQQLPDGYRIIFNLYVVEGYTHKEIASQLNISVNTSKSQLSRAKKMLRTVLENTLIN